jgi:hypothetical protein
VAVVGIVIRLIAARPTAVPATSVSATVFLALKMFECVTLQFTNVFACKMVRQADRCTGVTSGALCSACS